MRLRIDRDRCIGPGLCVQIAPSVFDQDDEGLVMTLKEEPTPDEESAVRAAVDRCPGRALGIVEP